VDLIGEVTERLSVDEAQARRGLGTLFVAIRMALDMRTFTTIATAFPDVGEWMVDAPFQGDGTGEMLVMATPSAVRRTLAVAEFDDGRATELCQIVGDAIKTQVSPTVLTTLNAKLPLFG